MAYGLQLKGNRISLTLFCVESDIGHDSDSIAFIEDILSIDDAIDLKRGLTYYIKMLNDQTNAMRIAEKKRTGKKRLSRFWKAFGLDVEVKDHVV